MKKQAILLTAAVVMSAALTACSGTKTEATAAATAAEETTAKEASAEDTAAADETSTEETKAAGGKLTMATNAEFPPYEYHEGGEIVGIDVEIAKAIGAKMGMEVEIEDIAFDSIIPEITSGKADFGAAGMTVTPDRLANVDFSDPYASDAAQMIIVKEGGEIQKPEDLTGKAIGVQLGTTGDIFVTDNVEDAAVERYSKGFEGVQALLQGKIDAVVIDGEPAKVFVEENEGITMLEEPLTKEEYAIAVKKGSTELLEQINAAIKELKESGELQAIIDKYTGK